MNAWDQALFLWLNLGPAAPHVLVRAATWISVQGPNGLLAATLAVALFGRDPWRIQCWRVLPSMALAALVATVLRPAFRQPRPFDLHQGTQWIEHASTPGFPSAHTSVMMALAVSLALTPGLRAWARPLPLAFGLAMAWSRVALGVHFPSDVLAGMVVGAVCAQARHVAERDRLARQQRGAELGQRGVLRPRDGDFALEPAAAAEEEFVHEDGCFAASPPGSRDPRWAQARAPQRTLRRISVVVVGARGGLGAGACAAARPRRLIGAACLDGAGRVAQRGHAATRAAAPRSDRAGPRAAPACSRKRPRCRPRTGRPGR
jgi:undecaprenyl-diphosphatase